MVLLESVHVGLMVPSMQCLGAGQERGKWSQNDDAFQGTRRRSRRIIYLPGFCLARFAISRMEGVKEQRSALHELIVVSG